LPFSLNEDQLAEFLGNLSIKSIRFPKEFETGRPKGFAYIEFDDRESLVKALELDGHVSLSLSVYLTMRMRKLLYFILIMK
jgi:RNA recognition motif-containing protein